jgi:DNA-binding CsgD family transcriptional regulator
MSTPIRASDRDLRALAAIVSQNREDLPADEELPPSLLADLKDQIHCDDIWLDRYDSERQETWWLQQLPALSDDGKASEDADPPFVQHWWACHWDSRPCSHPERTGDLRSVLATADFYSARQWHSTAMYSEFYRPNGHEHELQLCLPDPAAGLSAGPWRTIRLILLRGPGPDFSERDRALLVLLRPHLHQAYLDAEQRRHPVPRLTPRQNELLRLVAAGRTNSQIARQLGISEGTVRTHLENIYQKLGVSSRTAAVTRAFPDRMVQDPPRAARPADQAALVTPARSTGRRYQVRGAQKET